MKHLLLPMSCLLVTLMACSPADQEFYAVEMNGNLVGYVAATNTYEDDGATLRKIDKETYLKLTLLGQPVDIRVRESWELDPVSGRVATHETSMRAGRDMKLATSITFEDGLAHFEPRTGGVAKTIELEPDVLIDDGRGYWFLAGDLAPDGPASKTFRRLDMVRGEIDETEFTRRASETLVFDDVSYECLVFDAFNRSLGASSRLWVDHEGDLVRLEDADGSVVYPAPESIRTRIRRASVDDMIFANVDEMIEDFTSLRTMRVEAQIRSAGQLLTAESLNVPGQKFVGTVHRNLVEGVFEIAHVRFDGQNAPAFPYVLTDESMQKYLEPEILIEADDPVLVAKSHEITAGATDAWQAAQRISRWVIEHIGEGIPGGSARQTFDSRKGECGSHSRLTTALCRASGIPARLVSGCMYVPLRGGSFGQHAWNEVYMGEAGWIPFDTTVEEADYVDSGHIRLGETVTFNPVRMRILDYELSEDSPAEDSQT